MESTPLNENAVVVPEVTALCGSGPLSSPCSLNEQSCSANLTLAEDPLENCPFDGACPTQPGCSECQVTVPPTFDSCHDYTLGETLQFENRYDNGYDIFTDQKYVQWLSQYHPEVLPVE